MAWQSTLVFLHGESHAQRSLEGYSSWGRYELDTTEATWHARKDLYVCLCSMPHYMVESGNQAKGLSRGEAARRLRYSFIGSDRGREERALASQTWEYSKQYGCFMLRFDRKQ